MNAQQARAMLELIADLYLLASTPEPEPVRNGKVEHPEAVKAEK